MTRTTLSTLLLVTVAWGCSTGTRLPHTTHGQEVLEIRGSIKGAPFRLGEADVEALDSGKVRGLDPVTGREATYEGMDLSALLDRLDLTGDADTVIVRTDDRQAVPVPLSLVRELRPVLAARADGAPLPARLVAWPNIAHHGLTTDPRAALWWARKVVALEYVSWATAIGRALRIPEGAPAGALVGAAIFGSRCLACHRIREAGGADGPELTQAGRAPTAEALAAKLPGHPGWTSQGTAPPRPEAISQLATFLWTVARAPDDKEEDEPEPEPRPEVPPSTFPFTPPR
jgi:hypothetical protein